MTYETATSRAETGFPGAIRAGAKGIRAKRVQEWLGFHDCGTAIDSDFGPGTARAVAAFQERKRLSRTGVVDRDTWSLLVQPMAAALEAGAPAGTSLDRAVLQVAKAHLAQGPLELGPDNCGPWVRLYTGGYEGPEWRWCAAFVTFVLKQACAAAGRPMPVAGSPSCDSLAAQAKAARRLVSDGELASGAVPWSALGRCQVFLVRRTATDWVHTGFSFAGKDQAFSTIEGNTNDSGSANGYEVCQRVRGVTSKNFIRIA